MWSPRLTKMSFYCCMVIFYCSIVRILLFSNFLHLNWNLVGDIFGLWGIQMWSPRLAKMSFYCCMVNFYCCMVNFHCSIGRILLFSKLFTFKLKFGRWHIWTIGNSNVKSKIDKKKMSFYCCMVHFYCFQNFLHLRAEIWHVNPVYNSNFKFVCENRVATNKINSNSRTFKYLSTKFQDFPGFFNKNH